MKSGAALGLVLNRAQRGNPEEENLKQKLQEPGGGPHSRGNTGAEAWWGRRGESDSDSIPAGPSSPPGQKCKKQTGDSGMLSPCQAPATRKPGQTLHQAHSTHHSWMYQAEHLVAGGADNAGQGCPHGGGFWCVPSTQRSTRKV